MTLPTKIAVDPNDNILVYDTGNHRFTVFDNDGQLVRTMDFSRVGYNQVEEVRIDEDGMVYLETREPDYGGTESGNTVNLVRLTPDFANETVIVSRKVNDYVYRMKGSTLHTIPLPFNQDLYWDVLPSGRIVAAWSGDYEITILTRELEEIRKFHHREARVEVTEDDRQQWFRSIGSPQGEIDAEIRDVVDFPKYKPHFFRLATDEHGFVIFFTYKMRDDN